MTLTCMASAPAATAASTSAPSVATFEVASAGAMSILGEVSSSVRCERCEGVSELMV